MERKGLGIIFHSDSYDRVCHGLSIALAGLALGREVKLFFSYDSLRYLGKDTLLHSDGNKEIEKDNGGDSVEKENAHKIRGLIVQVKAMGAECHLCSGSMKRLNITRNEIMEEVDNIIGITAFLTGTVNYQLLFI